MNIQEKANNQFPKEGDTYYYYAMGVKICSGVWDNSGIDMDRLSIDNAFKTKGEVERAIVNLKLLAEIKQWRKDNDPDSFKLDWTDDGKPKYYVYYDHYYKKLDCDVTYGIQHLPNPYFSRDKKAKEFIKHFGDRLKLLLGGV